VGLRDAELIVHALGLGVEVGVRRSRWSRFLVAFVSATRGRRISTPPAGGMSIR
jgi:hypothetical protein